MAGKRERARTLGATRRGAAMCRREERCERTTGRRRRREREPSSSHFLRLSSPFPNPSVSLYLRPRRPTLSPRTTVFRVLFRYALFHPRATRTRSLTGISPGRDLAFSLRPTLFALRPFNSIATPFYNAAAPCSARTEVTMAPNALLDPPTHDLAILHERHSILFATITRDVYNAVVL